MQLIKRKVADKKDEAIILQYTNWTKNLEDISDYILGKEKQITGYGENKERYQIKVSDILYFEAVGELVFAYTEKQVYEIKMRLYQVEENTRGDKMVRGSKSIVVNLRHIESVRPALNGRLYATMANGEEILISRQYAKEVTERIMAS